MGCYNSVFIKCPHDRCGASQELQSKAGDCSMTTYNNNAVPPAEANDLNGDTQRCTDCGRGFLIMAQMPVDFQLYAVPLGYANG